MQKNVVLSKIKLIIWDLDETLWDGILAEGDVKPNINAFNLIKNLNLRGIVSSICSKNDDVKVRSFLENIHFSDVFVFSSINYQEKAPRIQNIIQKMHLRDENCLFVDDNFRNLEEALFLMPNLMVSTPNIIQVLIEKCNYLGKDDCRLERLKQYKILEQKVEERLLVFDELQFLKRSDIRIAFVTSFTNELVERICELGERTHQLNYTKKALSHGFFANKKRNGIKCAAIQCKDKYGDYGCVGFYALSIKENKLIHYFFSCRTLGMHIEQYVYQYLNYPEIDIATPVTIGLLKNSEIDYIKVIKPSKMLESITYNDDVLIIGPCDLETVDYFLPWNPITEFRYFDDKKRLIGYGSHPLVLNNILDNVSYSKTDFFDPVVSNSTIFNGKYKVVIYSYITALLYGEYRNIKTGETILFGEWPFDATKSDSKSYKNSVCFEPNDKSWDDFRRDYEYIGRVDPINQAKRIARIVDHLLKQKTQVCLLLGSEVKYKDEKQTSMNDADTYSKYINDFLFDKYHNNNNVLLINPSSYIKSQTDYNGSIQHYSRRVYKNIADVIASNYSYVKRTKTDKKIPILLEKKPFFLERLRKKIRKLIKG